MPVCSQISTLLGVVVVEVLVADGGQGRGLDQSTSEENVDEVPHELSWPEKVPHGGLASARPGEQRPPGDVVCGVIAECEQRDVQAEAGIVRQDLVRQLDQLIREEVGG